MFTAVDSLIVLGIQDLKQITVLNPIFIDIGTTEPLITSFKNIHPKSLFTDLD